MSLKPALMFDQRLPIDRNVKKLGLIVFKILLNFQMFPQCDYRYLSMSGQG